MRIVAVHQSENGHRQEDHNAQRAQDDIHCIPPWKVASGESGDVEEIKQEGDQSADTGADGQEIWVPKRHIATGGIEAVEGTGEQD